MLRWISLRNVAVLLGAAGIWLVAFSLSHAAELKHWSKPAPPFVLRTLNGSAIDLDTLRGGVVIVHFFATWCEPCREELPALQQMVARSGEQPVTVIAISVADVELRVRRFFQSTPVDFPILLDPDRTVTKSWNILELPSTIILDSDLRPRLAVEGDFAWDQVDLHTLVDGLHKSHASASFSKFASFCNDRSCELRKQSILPVHEKGPRT